MQPALSHRLQQARQRFFVGRSGEMSAWLAALEAPSWPIPIWHVRGLGGMGKTSLLREWRRGALERGAQVFCLDARDFEPNGEAFGVALREVLGESSVSDSANSPELLCTALGAISERVVLQIDTCELLLPLDDWLRECFLPHLPANCAVTLAGRDPLPLAWRGDAGWRQMVRSFDLSALSDAESREYLTRREVPEKAQVQLLSWAHGHPLALSLAADVWWQQSQNPASNVQIAADSISPELADFRPADIPPLVGSLLEHLVREVPSPAHRAALEACAIVAVMSEELLGEMLTGAFADSDEKPDNHQLFGWLRSLGVMQSNRFGIFPHDLVREMLVADVRWRSPQWHGELHRSARQHYLRRIHHTSGAEQQRAIFNCIFLHRMSPGVAPYLQWQDNHCYLDAARAGELGEFLGWIEKFEGGTSRQIAARWFELQSENCLAVRGASGAAQGFVFQLALHRADLGDIEADPGALAAWQYLQTRAPLRAGEGATLFRFWMDKTIYQDVSASQSLIFVQSARHHITTPHLAFSFFPCAHPDFWRDGFIYADFVPLPACDFEVDSRPYATFGHDWRERPVLEWLDLLSQREMESVAVEAPPPERATSSPSFVFLEEAAFHSALRKALRGWSDAATLRQNSLLDTELVHRRALQIAVAGQRSQPAPSFSLASFAPSRDERVLALRSLLREAVAALSVAPRHERNYRALNLVFGRGILSQESAADAMNVSHSSFRRYLRAALEFVGDFLWQRQNSRGEIETASAFSNGENERNLSLF